MSFQEIEPPQVDRAALLLDVHAAIKAARRVAALFDAGEFDAADLLWSEDGPRPALVRLFQEFNNGGQVHERETVRKLLKSLHPKSPNQSHGQVVRDCCDAVLELIPEADNAEYLKQRTSDVADHFDVTPKTIREWTKSEKPPHRIRPSDSQGYVRIHPDDWKT